MCGMWCGVWCVRESTSLSPVFLLQGTVLLSPQVAPQTEWGCSCYEFEACVTSGEGLRVGVQVTLYIGAAVQNAVVKVGILTIHRCTLYAQRPHHVVCEWIDCLASTREWYTWEGLHNTFSSPTCCITSLHWTSSSSLSHCTGLPPPICLTALDVLLLFISLHWMSSSSLSHCTGRPPICLTALDVLLLFVSLQEKHEPLDKHGDLVVTFAFLRQQEFVQKHSRLLFREGRVKGTGVVTKLNPGAPAPQTRTRKLTN